MQSALKDSEYRRIERPALQSQHNLLLAGTRAIDDEEDLFTIPSQTCETQLMNEIDTIN